MNFPESSSEIFLSEEKEGGHGSVPEITKRNSQVDMYLKSINIKYFIPISI